MKKILKNLSIIALISLASSFAFALNINEADSASIIKELKGIGAVKAEAIIEFREKHGPFSGPNDLLNVPGIGLKTLEGIQDQLTFDVPEETTAEVSQE